MRVIHAALLLAVSASPALAQREPVIVIPGKPGVPVYINGIDASWGVVEGEFGLDRPGVVTPTVTYRPLTDLGSLPRPRLLSGNRPAPRLWPPGDRAAGQSCVAAAGADLLPQLVERIRAGPCHRISAVRSAAGDRLAEGPAQRRAADADRDRCEPQKSVTLSGGPLSGLPSSASSRRPLSKGVSCLSIALSSSPSLHCSPPG